MLCCINLVLRPKSRRYGRPFRLFTSRLSSSTGGLELLCRMNAGKPGRPFQYPESFIAWMARIYTFLQMPDRQMEEVCPETRDLPPPVSWRRTIPPSFRRIQRLDLPLPGCHHRRRQHGGEGVREKWRVRRGWITVHGKINVETRSRPEVDDPMYRAVRCPGSTAARSTLCIGCRVTETRDRNDLFNTLEERGILAGTDAATRSTGSRPTGPNACDVVAGHRLRHAIGRSKRSSPASNRSSGDGSGDVTGGDAPRGKDGIERL